MIPEPQKIERSAGGLGSLTAAAKLLAEAKRPVIVSGKDKLQPTEAVFLVACDPSMNELWAT